jgi:hypothetical protein
MPPDVAVTVTGVVPAAALASVEIVKVVVGTVVPFPVTDVGLKLQVAPVGKPEQAKV